jgi:hypothetical protein
MNMRNLPMSLPSDNMPVPRFSDKERCIMTLVQARFDLYELFVSRSLSKGFEKHNELLAHRLI